MARACPSLFRLPVALWLANAVVSPACQVPVFRYALERWEPTAYLVSIVPPAGGLTDADKTLVDQLSAAPRDPVNPGNFEMRLESPNPALHDQARMALHYPRKLRDEGRDPPISQAPLTAENVRILLDSPVRQELRRRLLAGESALWLLVESGNSTKDEAAAKALGQALEQAEKTVTLPAGVIASGARPADPANALQSDVPLKVEFSILRVQRNDPREAALLAMLTHVEPDLGNLAGEPMAFPVFGRGRVLEPLVGAGIHDGNVLEHSLYLCGACSCEVKDQNPGIDLLMTGKWDPVETMPEPESVRITPRDQAPPARMRAIGPLAIGVVLLGLGAWRLARG